MLEQQLLGPEAQRALAGHAVGADRDRDGDAVVIGQCAGGAFDASSVGGMIEHGAKRTPVLDQCGGRTERAAAAFGLGQRLDCMALGQKSIFGLHGAGCRGHRADRRGQADEVEPLAVEGVGGIAEPIAYFAVRRGGEREIGQAGVATVNRAQQVDGIGKVAGRRCAGRGKQGGEMGMARRAFGIDSRQLRRGDTCYLLLDCRLDRHLQYAPTAYRLCLE